MAHTNEPAVAKLSTKGRINHENDATTSTLSWISVNRLKDADRG